MPKRLPILFIIYFVCGCSLQAQHPAPVQSINFDLPNINKGSIKSDRYKVKRGDTLYSIAWGANKDVSDLASINDLDQAYTIYPGQVLLLSIAPPNKNHKKIKANTNEGNSLKNKHLTSKTIAHKKNQAYFVTKSKQNNNKNLNKNTDSTKEKVTEKVNQWSWPVTGKIISQFNDAGQVNNGIKIAGVRGDIIKAAADGRVVYAGNGLRGYGNLIIIKHSEDYLSAYAHTNKILVKEKQQVNMRQAIATMGRSEANQVMLHFEIRYHGKSVNPLKYLPKMTND